MVDDAKNKTTQLSIKFKHNKNMILNLVVIFSVTFMIFSIKITVCEVSKLEIEQRFILFFF